MKAKEDLSQINLYINEVSRLLPYPQSKKKEVLEELGVDVQAAMKDSGEKSPSIVFGTPHDTAKNVCQAQNWHNIQATWHIRFFAWLIDWIFLTIFLMMIIGVGFLATLTFMSYEEMKDEFSQWESSTYDWNSASSQAWMLMFVVLLMSIIAIIVFFGYNIGLEYYYGATIGKKFLNLIVVDQTGIRITWKQAIIRNISKILVNYTFLLPIDVLLGILREKRDPNKAYNQRGLDIIAETIVVKLS
ncbi:MAG: RDD family protein [Candidatus Thorarchaeota archaeon]